MPFSAAACRINVVERGSHRAIRCVRAGWLALVLGLAGALPVSAQVRFDVFVGLDGYIPTHGWFPISCEVQNDGPTFTGLFEVTSEDFNGGEVRRLRVELPTGTLKRFSIPFHANSTYSWRFNARLSDERGKIQAESLGINARRQVPREIPISATVGSWMPSLPEAKSRRNRQDYQPVVARLLPPLFPDNPICLETVECLYLGSDRALELGDPQVDALLTWMQAGGHLVVGVKQINHLGGSPWLESLLPVQIASLELTTNHGGFEQWVAGDRGVDGRPMSWESWTKRQLNQQTRNTSGQDTDSSIRALYTDLKPDTAFARAPMEVARGNLIDGRAVIGAPENPLVVSAERGRGRLTVLMFNPEQKPFSDWTNGPYFWAKIYDIPAALFVEENINLNRYQSVDGVYASMVDSHQVRKLPVGWLLLLLVGYLVVIGPLDRYWLKKINRQMLTWLTFPAYVAFFSLLIYFIGYKLRAGETEWNELHVVDILPKTRQAHLHGWTYGSIYSPANARYEFQGDEDFSAFRGEFGGGSSGRHWMEQRGNNFLASVSVPVWTSQFFASDWWRTGLPPLSVSLRPGANGWTAEVRNESGQPIEHLFLVMNERLHELGNLAAEEAKTFEVEPSQGIALHQFVNEHSGRFQEAINRRRNPLSGNAWEVIQDIPRAAVAASFVEESEYQPLLLPFGQDLNAALRPGQALVLAWMPEHSPLSSDIHQFRPRRHHQDTLWRLAVPLTRQP